MISNDLDGSIHEINISDLSWRPSAYGICLRDNKVLLLHQSGKYHLPGGGIELDEHPEDAVTREIIEETGIPTFTQTLIDIRSTFFSWKSEGKDENLRHVHALLFYYLCSVKDEDNGRPALTANEKYMGLHPEWIETDELDNITVGTTVDWRPVVKEAVLIKNSKYID
ncbi:MAG TPA: NUDIX domain-containing protein [Candidatus Saccharimonadales bacterium]|jgi:8-oxo-dGTP diphosphatase